MSERRDMDESYPEDEDATAPKRANGVDFARLVFRFLSEARR